MTKIKDKNKDLTDKESTEDKDAQETNADVEESEMDTSSKIDQNRRNAKLPLRTKIKNYFKDPKKRLKFLLWTFIILLAALVGAGLYYLSHDDDTSNNITSDNKSLTVPTQPTLYESPLDGVMVEDESITSNHPLAIIVENHPDARPQAGLDKASVVYEALSEGGITRFMGIFTTKEAEKVGPVRSARTYFVDWAHGYDAYFAHVGGNIDALDKIPVDKILDLDQFKYSSAYWRERAANVASEHTMFTSTTKLREQAEKNKYSASNNFSTYKFKDDPADDTLPQNQKITIDYSNNQYKVAFEYDKSTNSYKRYMAGKIHTDQISKKAINPKNIIVMTVKAQPTVTRINEPGLTMTTIGEGSAQFFLDGKAIKGSWRKESKDTREMFFDQDGKEIVFSRGQTWICVVPPDVKPVAE